MRVPSFIKTQKQLNQFNNLMVNCDTADQMYEGLLSIWLEMPHTDKYVSCADVRTFLKMQVEDVAEEFIKPLEYTLLSPYYFVQSKNDPTNSLKYTHTRTYTGREYSRPLAYLATEK